MIAASSLIGLNLKSYFLISKFYLMMLVSNLKIFAERLLSFSFIVLDTLKCYFFYVLGTYFRTPTFSFEASYLFFGWGNTTYFTFSILEAGVDSLFYGFY